MVFGIKLTLSVCSQAGNIFPRQEKLSMSWAERKIKEQKEKKKKKKEKMEKEMKEKMEKELREKIEKEMKEKEGALRLWA